MNEHFTVAVASMTMKLLLQHRAIVSQKGPYFRVSSNEQDEFVTITCNPSKLIQKKIDETFAHELQTLLYGRPVILVNGRGLWLLVGKERAREMDWTPVALDLSKQPTPWSLPIGMTKNGDLWVSLLERYSFLIAGLPGKGKSAMLHGFVQALLHGEKTDVWAWDGKDDLEYGRYADCPHFTLIPVHRLQDKLSEIANIAKERRIKMAPSGMTNIVDWNVENQDDPFNPIALVIDEIAEVKDQEKLLHLVSLCRASGVYPIFATNNPGKATVVAKSQIGTRIAFKVVSHNDSSTILGYPSAEKLPDVRGRGLILHSGLTEFQGYLISYPKPSDAVRQMLAEQSGIPAPATQKDADDEQVRKLIELDVESDAAIVRLVWGVSGGASYYRLKSKVEAMRKTSSSSKIGSSGQKTAENRPFAEEEVQEMLG